MKFELENKGWDCIICGVGGQGSVLLSRLLAQCALYKGISARTAETIGMAQRGGSVTSHVRTGKTVHSPLIPKGGADLLLGLEPAEALRGLSFLKPGGIAVVSKSAVVPVTSMLGG
ncbi:MAG: 2-oxoacid:acceptor oxidoreductase family protein, partial [Firmicutes bacterium]|nr:2-oxoacid:acceptor oxidoreductase family protein [Bacillota bacterium]